MERDIEIVVISDVHLGTYGCHAQELLNYLKGLRTKTLILNGDFIDIWQFKKSYFPKEHMEVIQQVLRMAISGAKVYYITGNHDDTLRKFSEFSTGAFNLRDRLMLQLRGKRHLIFHGDIFDASVMYSPWLAKLGAKSYDYLILFNQLVNKMRGKFGLPKLSFAAKVKKSVKKAVKYVSDFEQTAIELAVEEGFDYVICGHIHKPQIRIVETSKGKVTYLNSGDWVENLTALEYNNGHWSLYEYRDHHYRTGVKNDPAQTTANHLQAPKIRSSKEKPLLPVQIEEQKKSAS